MSGGEGWAALLCSARPLSAVVMGPCSCPRGCHSPWHILVARRYLVTGRYLVARRWWQVPCLCRERGDEVRSEVMVRAGGGDRRGMELGGWRAPELGLGWP